jgi:hypothetical protein
VINNIETDAGSGTAVSVKPVPSVAQHQQTPNRVDRTSYERRFPALSGFMMCMNRLFTTE